MANLTYDESTYRFSDPIRFFKANDPYYFEVDNIPLKQLQENCLWLKDQLTQSVASISNIKRGNIDELRPYSNGTDRVVRVHPGRFTARINDASRKEPLQFLSQVMGEAVGDVNAWQATANNAGEFPAGVTPSYNTLLVNVLNKFKSQLSQDALNMNGLAERAFTWPVVNSDTPVNTVGAITTLNNGVLGFSTTNQPGGGAFVSPLLVSQALLWAKSTNSTEASYLLPTFETTNTWNGFVKLPRTESHFIKKWRGVTRMAIVDVPSELSITVPPFSQDDFSYIDETGQEVSVDGVQQRIDMVFIYSKPVDASGVRINKGTGVQTLTTPQLGIVRGAGIKASFKELDSIVDQFQPVNAVDSDGNAAILASPADSNSLDSGFTATSGNDIEFSVRGSFPAPDDLLNIAPLLSEKLENTAIELVGQSILPVAYVWVHNTGSSDSAGGQVLLTTDVIDIRPLFRTAELAYNERAGIAAAFPQLSLANPAVGKSELNYELKRMFDDINARITVEGGSGGGGGGETENATGVLATGYLFGGWNFGPEGALFDYYQTQFAADADATNDTRESIRAYIRGKYGIGSAGATINVPTYPDWDLSQWCQTQTLEDKGLFPNDYINTFISTAAAGQDADVSIAAASYRQKVNANGTGPDGEADPLKLRNFENAQNGSAGLHSKINFHFISKRIKFNRSLVPWLADYNVDVSFLNCLPQVSRGTNNEQHPYNAGSYFGHWVEKNFDEFVIYVAFVAPDNNVTGVEPGYPAPHTMTITPGGKKQTTTTNTISERDGGRFSSFIVPVEDILYTQTTPLTTSNKVGYVGNPRIGKCTYPTVMWKFTGVPLNDAAYLYGNLNGTNPTITLKA